MALQRIQVPIKKEVDEGSGGGAGIFGAIIGAIVAAGAIIASAGTATPAVAGAYAGATAGAATGAGVGVGGAAAAGLGAGTAAGLGGLSVEALGTGAAGAAFEAGIEPSSVAEDVVEPGASSLWDKAKDVYAIGQKGMGAGQVTSTGAGFLDPPQPGKIRQVGGGGVELSSMQRRQTNAGGGSDSSDILKNSIASLKSMSPGAQQEFADPLVKAYLSSQQKVRTA